MANALVDVLVGASEPAGRLPTTFPIRLEHNPSYGNFPGENGQIRYGEGVLVGYRWYEARRLPVRFPFGHGLSYTTFTIGEPRPSSSEILAGATLAVDVPVTNTGGRRGAEVVQCYVAPPSSRVVRPPKELKAFAKVWLDPGQTATVRLELDDRAFAYWEPGDPDWAAIQARLAGSVPYRPGAGASGEPTPAGTSTPGATSCTSADRPTTSPTSCRSRSRPSRTSADLPCARARSTDRARFP